VHAPVAPPTIALDQRAYGRRHACVSGHLGLAFAWPAVAELCALALPPQPRCVHPAHCHLRQLAACCRDADEWAALGNDSVNGHRVRPYRWTVRCNAGIAALASWLARHFCVASSTVERGYTQQAITYHVCDNHTKVMHNCNRTDMKCNLLALHELGVMMQQACSSLRTHHPVKVGSTAAATRVSR
jgi:hypothetical protein